MRIRYRSGDTVYIIESVRFIRQCVVLRFGGGLYTLRFADSPGGVRLRENRLFPTEEAAKRMIG